MPEISVYRIPTTNPPSEARQSAIDAIDREFVQLLESALPPSTVGFHLGFGQFRADNRDFEGATKSFQEAARLAPRDSSVYLTWSRALRESQNAEFVIDLMLKAAGIMEQENRLDESRAVLHNALIAATGMNRVLSKVIAHLANLELRQSRIEIAYSLLASQGESVPDDPHILISTARVHLLWGNYSDAQECIGSAVSVAEERGEMPLQSLALAAWASLQSTIGMPNAATDLFERAVSASRCPQALAAYAYHLAISHDIEKATKLIEEAESSDPTDPEVWSIRNAIIKHKDELQVFVDILIRWDEIQSIYSTGGLISTEQCYRALTEVLQIYGCIICSELTEIAKGIYFSEIDMTTIFEALDIQRTISLVIFVVRWREDDFDKLLRELDHRRKRYVVVVLLDKDPDKELGRIREKYRIRAKQLGILSSLNIRNLVILRNTTLLKHLLLRQFQISRLAPYQTSHPVENPDMFFGREREMASIHDKIRHVNISLIGGRQIGKSTILFQMQQVQNYQPIYQMYYCDVQNCMSLHDVLHKMRERWIGNDTSTARKIQDFNALFEYLCRGCNDHPVFLIDEVDQLIKLDKEQDFPFFRAARTYSQSGTCHFVVCGERTLQAEIFRAEPKSPLHNFCDVFILERLEQPAVRELIRTPMRQLGIELDAVDEIVDVVWNCTSGHPLLVQWICEQCVKEMENSRWRLLTKKHVEHIVNSQHYVDRFLATTLSGTTVLERICLYRIVLNRDLSTEQDLYAAICALGVSPSRIEVSSALGRLESLRGLLSRSNQQITIAMPALIETLERGVNAEYELLKWKELYRQMGDVDPNQTTQFQSYLTLASGRVLAFFRNPLRIVRSLLGIDGGTQ